jgi:DNA-binding transcriptional LysR family regulator
MAITALFRDYGYDLKPEIELGSVDLLIEFARKGLGISFVTREFAAKELAEGSLFEIKLDVELPPSQVGVMTLRNLPLSKAANEFIKRIG